MSRKHFFPNLSAIVLAMTCATFGQSTWTENSFEDFIDGQFLDAGSNLYVSAKGRMQIINRWDLNGDGHLDIVLPAGHGHTEKENLFIYLNNSVDIDGRSRIELPGGGSRAGVVADFNKDGLNDIAIANSADSHYKRVSAWLWYGTSKGFTPHNRTELPAFRGNGIAAGDFNGDGWLDLAIACQWQAGTVARPEGPLMSFIYWNSPQGFRPEKRLPLIFDGQGAIDVAAEDFDNDGHDDLVATAAGRTFVYLSSDNAFQNEEKRIVLPLPGRAVATGDVNGDNIKDLAVCTRNGVEVLTGDGSGFGPVRPASLQVTNPADVTFADVNRDGCDEVIVACNSTSAGASWTDSYVFLSDRGRLDNSRVMAVPTFAATGVSAGDLNGDGFPELVFSNQRVGNQLNICSYVYWNDHGRFYFGNHTQLPTLGPTGNCLGDVNNDGLTDVIFFNDEGYLRDGPTTSYVYWGDGSRSFSEKRRRAFHTHHVFGVGHADLDDDGFVDLVFAQDRFVYRIPHEQNGLTIYWGDGNDFSPPTRLAMTTGYGGVRIADINKDGYLDMVAGGACVDLKDPDRHGFPIYWGSPLGFDFRNRTVLHFEKEKMRAPLLMDLNRDGWLDIAGQVVDGKVKIWWGSSAGYDDARFAEIDLGRPDHLMYIKGADFNRDGWLDLLLPKRMPHEEVNTSFIYFGSANGFSNDNRIEILSHIPYDNSIADFDRDGWLDIFLVSYGTDEKGNRPSLIHWGGPDGFGSRAITELPTHGASGSEALDYDGDGWLDVFVVNHRQAGSYDKPIPHRHLTPAFLYWGGPDGFSPQRSWQVPATGPSGLNIRDLGNSYDRRLYEDYISSAHEIPAEQKPRSISWQAETPHGTLVKFQVRLANTVDGLQTAEWQGPDGGNSWFTKPSSTIRKQKGKWIQYRARLTTPNGGATPYLTSVSIRFE